MQNFELGDSTFELWGYFRFILDSLMWVLCSYFFLDLRYEIKLFYSSEGERHGKPSVSCGALSQSTYHFQQGSCYIPRTYFLSSYYLINKTHISQHSRYTALKPTALQSLQYCLPSTVLQMIFSCSNELLPAICPSHSRRIMSVL